MLSFTGTLKIHKQRKLGSIDKRCSFLCVYSDKLGIVVTDTLIDAGKRISPADLCVHHSYRGRQAPTRHNLVFRVILQENKVIKTERTEGGHLEQEFSQAKAL